MSLGSIIKQKRKQFNLTLDKVADLAGCSKPYLSTIENEKVKNPPSDTLLIELEKILQFDQGLLRHIAHMQRLPADVRGQVETAEAQNEKLKHLVKNLINTKEDIAIENILADNDIDVASDSDRLTSGKLVPVINKVSAGYPEDFNDLDYPVGIADDYVRCPDMHDPNAFAVRVVGDSMEPRFFEGNIVIFSPSMQVNSGDDCFIRFKDPHETTFKRIFFENDDTVRLQPRNDKYSPVIVPASRINGAYRAVRKIEIL
jgi:repressor LexA